jgi:hypothetical protein
VNHQENPFHKHSPLGHVMHRSGSPEIGFIRSAVRKESPSHIGLVGRAYSQEGADSLRILAEKLSCSIEVLSKEQHFLHRMTRPNPSVPLYLISKKPNIRFSPGNPTSNLHKCPTPLRMLATPTGCQTECSQASCPCKPGNFIDNPYLVSDSMEDYLVGLLRLLKRSSENRALFKQASTILAGTELPIRLAVSSSIVSSDRIASPSNLEDVQLNLEKPQSDARVYLEQAKSITRDLTDLRNLTRKTKKEDCSVCKFKSACLTRKSNSDIRGCTTKTETLWEAKRLVKTMLRQSLGLPSKAPLPKVNRRARYLIRKLTGASIRLKIWSRRQWFKIEAVTYGKDLLDASLAQTRYVPEGLYFRRVVPPTFSEYTSDRVAPNPSLGVANPVNLIAVLIYRSHRWDQHRLLRIVVPLVDLLAYAPEVETAFYEPIPEVLPGMRRCKYLEDFVNRPMRFFPGSVRTPRFLRFSSDINSPRIIFDSESYDLTSPVNPVSFLKTCIHYGSPRFLFPVPARGRYDLYNGGVPCPV